MRHAHAGAFWHYGILAEDGQSVEVLCGQIF